MTPNFRPESPADHPAIAAVNSLAFGGDAEARLIDALRSDGQVLLSLVAEVAGQVVGHILFSRLAIITETETIPAVALAPMAVRTEMQRQGIGCRLVEEGLRLCRERGERIVLVVGHPDYYPRFGFSAQLAQPLACPFGHAPAWMALELSPGALAGIRGRVQYPPSFSIFE